MYILVVYVPTSHAEALKSALFDAGAGSYAGYDRCSWQTEGMGQFRPLEGSNPFIGKKNVIEQVKEIRIEMACDEELIPLLTDTIKKNHPYEVPAFHFSKVIF